MAKIGQTSRQVVDALVSAGMITDPNAVARVLIDIQAGHAPMVYVQRYATDDDSLVAVINALAAEFNPAHLVDPAQFQRGVKADG